MLQLQERLKSHIKLNNLRHNEVSKAIGYSETSLSQWLSGSYKADTKGIDENIFAYLEREEAREKEVVKNPNTVVTNAVNILFDSAKLSHLDKRMRVICGEAGIGKTTAIKEYEKANTGVIIINSNITISPKKLCKLFYEKLGIAGSSHTGDMLDEIILKLKDTDKLVIIDEAEYLPYKALEIIRTIYNECNIGILLVGTPDLYYNLKGQKNQHSMLWSRVTRADFLKELTLKETESIVKQYFTEIDKEVVKEFHKLSEGNTRTLINLIVNTFTLTTRTGHKINKTMIKIAIQGSMKA